MTLRLSLLAALVLAGCSDSAGPSGGGDLDADDPFSQFSYSAGFQSGEQFVGQDSSFSYDRFVDGFRTGVDGDSAEIAYALGLQFGLQVRADTSGPLSALDRDLFLAGVREALDGDSSRVSEDDFLNAQAAVEDSLQIRALRKRAASDPTAQQQLDLMARNAVAADSFLTSVGAESGAQRTSSGVVYRVTEQGEGASPNRGDRVAIRYQGRFANGEIFDQSGEEPAVLPVDNVVPGFRDALLDMKPGETRTVTIPPSQAYGLLGQPGRGGQGGIPPNAALQFDITLVEVLDAQMQLPQGFQQPPPGR